MTNYEKIKNMSIEQMALFLESLLPDCTYCIVDTCSPNFSKDNCRICTKRCNPCDGISSDMCRCKTIRAFRRRLKLLAKQGFIGYKFRLCAKYVGQKDIVKTCRIKEIKTNDD